MLKKFLDILIGFFSPIVVGLIPLVIIQIISQVISTPAYNLEKVFLPLGTYLAKKANLEGFVGDWIILFAFLFIVFFLSKRVFIALGSALLFIPMLVMILYLVIFD